MKIVRYKARTMQEALLRVRGDLGAEAIIMSTRTLSPPLRWLGRECVEVVAAPGPRLPRRPEPAAVGVAAPAGPSLVDQGPRARERGQPSPVHPFTRSPLHPSPDLADLQREIQEVRDALGRVMAWTAPRDEASEAIVARLVDTGLSPELARELAGGPMGDPAQATWDGVRAAVAERVMVMGTSDLLAALVAPVGSSSGAGPPDARGPLVVALVGPTGVGKTTTIAKLAARHALAERRAVALVTLDTYRVAAVDQIRTYARMLDVPLEVVVSLEDARPALERHRDKDLILVDTIGHGPNDEVQIGQLRVLLSALAPHQVHLALSAPTDRRTMLNALDRFSRLEPTHLLFTKLDEAAVFGAMVETAIRSRRPVSYFSYGQDVPERIAPAAVDRFAAAVCPEEC